MHDVRSNTWVDLAKIPPVIAAEKDLTGILRVLYVIGARQASFAPCKQLGNDGYKKQACF